MSSWYALTLCGVLAAACGAGKSRGDAEQFLAAHYDAIRRGDFETALSRYTEVFFQATPRDEWKKSLIATSAKLGVPEGFKITTLNVTEQHGLDPGIYVVLVSMVNYSNGTAEEHMTLYRSNEEGKFAINGHSIRKAHRQ